VTLAELAEHMERVAAELEQNDSSFVRLWAAHLTLDARQLRLLALSYRAGEETHEREGDDSTGAS